jgi:hypothetical protein
VTLGSYKLYFTDPQAGQVGSFGTIEEHGHPLILRLRLKIDGNQKISEMEVVALRKNSGVFSEPQNLVDKPIFHQALAPSERRSRAELIRVAFSRRRRRARHGPLTYPLRSFRQEQDHPMGRRRGT